MNEKLCKMIYAALEIKHIPFTMYKDNDGDTTIFVFKDNKVEVANEEIKLNGYNLESIYNVIMTIKSL